MILSAAAFQHNNPDSQLIALGLHVTSWVAQFAGHGFAEGRAPALLDNLVGGTSSPLSPHLTSPYTLSNPNLTAPIQIALVLAPFFVHLEILFPLGFKPELHKQINNLASIEVTRVRRAEGDKKRAAQGKKDL